MNPWLLPFHQILQTCWVCKQETYHTWRSSHSTPSRCCASPRKEMDQRVNQSKWKPWKMVSVSIRLSFVFFSPCPCAAEEWSEYQTVHAFVDSSGPSWKPFLWQHTGHLASSDMDAPYWSQWSLSWCVWLCVPSLCLKNKVPALNGR